jgi:uncharacterized protein
MQKPGHVFDRDGEWSDLTAFASQERLGATLGIVSGRRRQGKSYLLQALSSAMGGIYFAATQETEAVSLRAFADALVEHTGRAVRSPFRDWGEALSFLFREVRGRPIPVVIDEFPFLMRNPSSLPSIIQRELGPGGSGRESMARLLLCGSALSVMGRLLGGRAPLRGRAGLEIVIRPFGYRDAARFWGIENPKLAAMTHAVVGGTPAYGREFTGGDAPASLADFDAWVARTVLNPRSALFREARYLLAEETTARDPAVYHSVLAAVAEGRHTAGGIADYVGRQSAEIAHPLNVLEDCALLAREPDVFRERRPTYRITEPLVTFYEAVMRRDWAQLEIARGGALWPTLRQTFESQVMGPHFEELCREFALERGDAVFGEIPRAVGQGVVNDEQNRDQIQIDVAVMGRSAPNARVRILSLGEAKWGHVMDDSHVARLIRARDLLAARGFDTVGCVLACYGGAGFSEALRARARAGKERIELIDLERLYAA